MLTHLSKALGNPHTNDAIKSPFISRSIRNVLVFSDSQMVSHSSSCAEHRHLLGQHTAADKGRKRQGIRGGREACVEP